MDTDWVHPGDLCNLEMNSHPWEARLLWKFDSKTEMCGFCNCVAACWEGFHRCTDALENQIWTWRMFFGDGKMSADDMFILRRWIQYRTIFFVKKQYPPFAIFLTTTKWWHKNWVFPWHTLHLFLSLSTVFQPECNHWLL